MARIVAGNFAVGVGADFNGYGEGEVVHAGADRISVYFPAVGITEHYWGAYSYDGTGWLAGGTLHVYEQVLNGQQIVAVTNINAPATLVANAVLEGDTETVLDLVLGGPDEMWGSIYDDRIDGYGGADTLIALDGYDIVHGGAGDDDVNGNMGTDSVYGDDGNDWVRGGKDNDTIFGGAGDDPHVNGNIGDDQAFGGIGNDTVYGGQGNDSLFGESGSDSLSGDLGNDVMSGGAGADRFFFRPGLGQDAVADFNSAEGDRIALPAGTAYAVSNLDGSAVIHVSETEFILVYQVAPSSLGDWLLVV